MCRTWRLLSLLLCALSTGWGQDTLRALQLTSGQTLHGWEVDRLEGRSTLIRLPSHRGVVVSLAEIASASNLPDIAGAIVDQDTLPPLPRHEPLPYEWYNDDRTGSRHTGAQVDSARDGILYVSSGPEKRSARLAVPIGSIARLGYDAGGGFLEGALMGSGIGLIAGGLIGSASYRPPQHSFVDLGPGPAIVAGVVLGIIGGFVVGGVVGSSAQHSQVYDLSLLTPAEARTAVHFLFYDSLDGPLPPP